MIVTSAIASGPNSWTGLGWSGNSNALVSSDGDVVTRGISTGNTSALVCSNFGFAIPDGATIVGLQAVVRMKVDGGG